jgi:hypothetical protein
MDHILDGFSVSSIGTNTTGFISTLSPVIALVLGILLAFLVFNVIIGILSKGKKTDDEDEDIDDDDY